MQIKANMVPPVPVKNTLESVSITFTADETYWLIGCVGAQTDYVAQRIYDELTGEIAAATGERRDSFIFQNPITRSSLARATANRKGYGEASSEPETKPISFYYEGLWREVVNVSIKGRHLSGVELTRAGKVTNQFKTYLLTKINYS